jgi:prepilin-type N-terminal cleavage/methylation domain-containing protein
MLYDIMQKHKNLYKSNRAVYKDTMAEEGKMKKNIRNLLTGYSNCRGFTFTNSRGFTLIELCMVMAIIGVLATVALKIYTDSKRHMADAAALAETHGLGKAVLNAFIEGGDVDLTHDPGDGRDIGALDTSGNARKPIFKLSPSMQAKISGSSSFGEPGKGFISAEISHPLGSEVPYILIIDEDGDLVSFPEY